MYLLFVSTRKKIAVNTRFLLSNRMEGIGYFTHETLRHITQTHPEVDFYFLFDRSYSSEFLYADNVKPVVLFPQARHPFLWYWWFEVSVAQWLKKNQPDLFLSTDGFCSLQSKVATVAVMHDLSFEHYPQYVPWLTNRYYRHFMPRFARHAARIATVSEYSKQDIVTQYGIEPNKIDVVYSAAKDFFKPTDAATQQNIRNRYTGGAPYLLYVGSVNGRKNIKNMLLAFDVFKKRHGGEMKFLIAGSLGWSNDEMKAAHQQMKFSEAVVFAGRINEEELVKIIGSSFALMYVSLFEGFGVPPLEAMKCNVPSITSSTTSMPEITAGAALLANPIDANDIAEKIEALYLNSTIRTQLIDKGIKRANDFSWQQTAECLWQCCEKAMQTT